MDWLLSLTPSPQAEGMRSVLRYKQLQALPVNPSLPNIVRQDLDQQAIASDGFVSSDLYGNVVDKGIKASLEFLNEGEIFRRT